MGAARRVEAAKTSRIAIKKKRTEFFTRGPSFLRIITQNKRRLIPHSYVRGKIGRKLCIRVQHPNVKMKASDHFRRELFHYVYETKLLSVVPRTSCQKDKAGSAVLLSPK